MKGLVKRNTHVQYESLTSSGKKVMTKVKVFVHATDADVDGRAMTLAPRTYLSRLAKNLDEARYSYHILKEKMTGNVLYTIQSNLIPFLNAKINFRTFVLGLK